MTIFANCHLLWNVSLLARIGMTVRLVAISTYYLLLCLVAFFALNHLVLRAFEVKTTSIFSHCRLYRPFSFVFFSTVWLLLPLLWFSCNIRDLRIWTFYTCHSICFHITAVVSICFRSPWWNTDGNDSAWSWKQVMFLKSRLHVEQYCQSSDRSSWHLWHR